MEERAILLRGGMAQIKLERQFWDGLDEIAAEQLVGMRELIADLVDRDHDNASSALRVHVLEHAFGRAGFRGKLTASKDACEPF